MRKQIWMMALLSLSLTVAADEKIIGGTPAPAGAYPFFTSLTEEDGKHLCGRIDRCAMGAYGGTLHTWSVACVCPDCYREVRASGRQPGQDQDR